MQVKRRFVISVAIRRNGLPIRNPRVFDEDFYIGTRLAISSADKPFDRKPMISFMRGLGERRKDKESCDTGSGDR